MTRQGMVMRLAAVAATIAGALMLASPAIAAPGDLDPGFDGAGLATFAPNPGSNAELDDAAAQPDGKVVVAGVTRAPDPAGGEQVVGTVARYQADGSLDHSFGNAGVQTIDLGGTHVWLSTSYLALQPDGKVVVAVDGAHGGGHGASSTVLARLEADGSFDSTFGDGGRALVPRLSLRGLALAADGKLILGGVAGGHDVVARYLPNGSADPTFGSSGIARTGNPRYLIRDVAVQADGRIVTAGEECGHAHRCGSDEFAATRLTAAGRRDRSFTKNGMTTVGLWGHVRESGAQALAIDEGGRIALAGFGDTRHVVRTHGQRREVGEPKFAVVRLRRDGSVDRSFASAGHATTWFGASYPDPGGVDGALGAHSIAADGNELYVAGGAGRSFVDGVIALAAYRAHGKLDAGFGHGGKVTTRIPVGQWDSALGNGLALANGRLAVAGYQYNADEEEGGYEGPPHAGLVAMYQR